MEKIDIISYDLTCKVSVYKYGETDNKHFHMYIYNTIRNSCHVKVKLLLIERGIMSNTNQYQSSKGLNWYQMIMIIIYMSW